jgi:hypothetical protein
LRLNGEIEAKLGAIPSTIARGKIDRRVRDDTASVA